MIKERNDSYCKLRGKLVESDGRQHEMEDALQFSDLMKDEIKYPKVIKHFHLVGLCISKHHPLEG